MSTWISERLAGAAAALTAAALLAGCLGGAGGGAGGGAPPDAAAGSSAPGAVRVASGRVAVAGPADYCIDPVGTRDDRRGAFVLLGSCAALGGAGRPPPRRAALTAAVSPAGDGPAVADSLDTLAGFFGSEVGRRLLSRSGNAESVTLLSASARDGVLYLRLRDESPFEGAEVAPDYWRALFDLGPHVVTLSVLPLRTPPMRAEAGQALLEEFLASVRRVNAPPPAPSEPPASDPG